MNTWSDAPPVSTSGRAGREGAECRSVLGQSVPVSQQTGRLPEDLKVLYWDGTGLCLFAKRLERGKFVWPPIVDGGMLLTPAQLALLLETIDWRRTVAPEPTPRPLSV
jgi:transposase